MRSFIDLDATFAGQPRELGPVLARIDTGRGREEPYADQVPEVLRQLSENARIASIPALNCAIHRIAITQARWHTPARDYLARKQAEGKTRKEAIRCLKRQLVRTLWRLLKPSLAPASGPAPIPASSGVNLT